jgi:transposase-like protein
MEAGKNRARRQWSAKEKLAIVAEGRNSGSVSATCRRHGLSMGQYYQWEKAAREGALQALGQRRGRKANDPLVMLEAEVARLRGAVTELTLENLQLKKGLWQ